MRKTYSLGMAMAVLFLEIGTCNAQFKNILGFHGPNGSSPWGSLTLSGNKLYGMTQNGGANGAGNIFSVNTDGSGFKDLFDFNGVNGGNPLGSLTISGDTLYGMTASGGPVDAQGGHAGVIFSLHTDGTGYKVLMNFNGANGYGPVGSLTLSGNVLYGMTLYGGSRPGSGGIGNIFSIHTDGTGYKDLFDFVSKENIGFYPYGSLTLSGNVLYGMTHQDHERNGGSVFSIHTDGKNYKEIVLFNRTNGAYPYGSLTLSGDKLYGMTSAGGAHDDGNVFVVNTDGSGFQILYDFPVSGGHPYGSLTLSGNVLYGATHDGGTNNYGNVFSIKTDGTGYQDLFDFAINQTGASPHGDLTLSGNVLYGMYSDAGAKGSDDGGIFSLTVPK